MNPVKMIYVCDPAKAKTCRKSVCRQNPYSAVPVCEWTGNPEWAKTDAAGNPIIDWENTLLLLKQDIVRDVPAWDQVLDGPLVGPVLMLLTKVQFGIAVVKTSRFTVPQFVGQLRLFFCQGPEPPRIHSDIACPIRVHIGQGFRGIQTEPVHTNAVLCRKVIQCG